MTNTHLFCAVVLLFCSFGNPSAAQTLDYSKQLVVKLGPTTDVTLFGAADNDTDYYYVPFSDLFQLSRNSAGEPEFLFLRYSSDDKKEGTAGGLFHSIVTWVEPTTLRESLQQQLRTKIDDAIVKGCVPFQQDTKFFLASSLYSAENEKLITSGRAPVLPGSKVAMAAQLNAFKAQLFWESFKFGTASDLSLIFEYQIPFKAIKSEAQITIDWEKFKTNFAAYTSLLQSARQAETESLQFLLDHKVIDLTGTTLSGNTERAYAQNFIAKYLRGITPENPRANKQQRQTIRLTGIETDFTVPFQTIVNAGRWYDQVKDQPRCIGNVLLNDPFFKQRDISFVLDIDAAKAFEKNGVNYVSVMIKKARKTGNNYNNMLTIDKASITTNGLVRKISYATGEEKDVNTFEYQVQWSLAGGMIYPAVPVWEKTNAPAITIVAPAKDQELILEATGEAFEHPKLSRVTLEVRYWLLGVQKTEYLSLQTGQKGGGIATKTIFCDKDNPKLEYRFHFLHREKGRINTDWQNAEGFFFFQPILPASFLLQSAHTTVTETPASPAVYNGANNVVLRQNKDYALFFAVSDYTDGSYAKLQNPLKDTEAIAQELSQRYGFRTEMLKNPTRAQIKAKIEEYAKKFETKEFDPEGQLLLFFSGHGEFADGSGFFLPSDVASSDLEATAIAYPIWRSRIDNLACKHLLVVIDACYSGTFDQAVAMRGGPMKRPGEPSDAEKFYQEHLARTTRLFLASGGKEQTPDKSNFAKRLLEGLRTAQSPFNLLTAGQLFELYVKQIRPVPLFGEFGKDEAGSSFIFVKSGVPSENMSDAQTWEIAQKRGDGQIYLDNYPTGQFAELARHMIQGNYSLNQLKSNPPDNPPEVAEDSLIFVEGGTFLMGYTDGQEDEKPVHRVTLDNFYIGKYEVTQKLWYSVMGKYPLSLQFKGCDECPVESVSWEEVQDFIKKLNEQKPGKGYRLPTEAEWEYAARGGNKSKAYKFAGGRDIGSVAWYRSNAKEKTQHVGKKTPNEIGLYDMSGNVWEWCSDWYGDYTANAQYNPLGPMLGSDHVFRGGSWGNDSDFCRLSKRRYNGPNNRSDNVGFRLARSQ